MALSARIARGLTLVALIALTLGLASCGGDDDAGTSTDGARVAVGVYFSDVDGHLVRGERMVPAADPLRGALQELLAGPGEGDLLPAAPAGTRLLGASHAGDVARVDLSAEFVEGYPSGGAAAELAIVGPLVHTAAGAVGADAVVLTVEGGVPAPTGSQIDFGQPLRPGDFPG